MKDKVDRTTQYDKGSLTLTGAVMLETGVMIGAGIFALTGQMAEMTGALFPLAFLAAAIIVGFSAYSYIKISNAYPSAGGIGMYLHWQISKPKIDDKLLLYGKRLLNKLPLLNTIESQYRRHIHPGGSPGSLRYFLLAIDEPTDRGANSYAS